jgi:hypothetical protein
VSLTYTPTNGGGLAFTVDYDRFDCENLATGHGRWEYKCTIAFEGETIDAGPLRSGTTTRNDPERLGEMLRSFLSFFAAYVEAQSKPWSPGENGRLFPAECQPLAELLDAGTVALWGDEVARCI